MFCSWELAEGLHVIKLFWLVICIVVHRCLAKSFDLPPQVLKLLPVHFLGVLRLLCVPYGLVADHHPKRAGVLHFLVLCVDVIYTKKNAMLVLNGIFLI